VLRYSLCLILIFYCCICYRSRDFAIYQSFRYYIVHSASVTNIDIRMSEYNCTARRQRSRAWIQSRLHERVSFFTCRISLSLIRFVICLAQTSIVHCTCKLCITRRIIIFLVCMNPTVIFVAWNRYWNRVECSIFN